MNMHHRNSAVPYAPPPERRHPGRFGSRLLPPVLVALCAWTGEGRAQGGAFPITVEAEHAALRGAEVASEVNGFSGSGYAQGFDAAEDQVQFTFSVPREDYYTLRIRYLNGGGQSASANVMLDGVSLPGSGAQLRNVYDTTSAGASGAWLESDDSVQIAAGTHTVTLAGIGRAQVLVDSLQVLDRTQPSTTSTLSLLMNNWSDLIGIHHSSPLDAVDGQQFGPRLAGLHWKGDWSTNQIDGATAWFRDATAGLAYTDLPRFATNLYFTEEGLMNVDYLNYGEEALPFTIQKQYAMVPNEPILVVRYTLSNRSGQPRSLQVLEHVDLNNLSRGSRAGTPGDGSGVPGDAGPQPPSGNVQPISATWHPEYRAWIADLSASNGTFVVFGAFPAAEQAHEASTLASGQPLGLGSGLRNRFESGSELQDNEEASAEDLLLAIRSGGTAGVGGSVNFEFFYSVQPTMQAARAIAQRIFSGAQGSGSGGEAAGAGKGWIEQTRQEWRAWLRTGRSTVNSGDPGVDAAYARSLVVLRQSQQPQFGSFIASTNPAYHYKVWPRDATVSALSLAAAGYFDESAKYWMWMAGVQETGTGNESGSQEITDFPNGTWWTNYSYWSRDEPVPFVDPEWDSVGQFLIGVYHHWRLLNERDSQAARQFISRIYPAVVDSAEWIAGNVSGEQGHGMGPPGYSVWEEDFEYAIYTQVTFASGLNAASQLARQMNETGRAQEWHNDAVTIRNSITSPVSGDPCRGMWDADDQFFIRGILPPQSSESGQCEPHLIVDGASELVWVFGLLPANSTMVRQHRLKVLEALSPPFELPQDSQCDVSGVNLQQGFGHGIARYEGDTFYFSAEFSPGGQCESTVPMPSWPWISSYMSMLEHWLGMDDLAFARIQWYTSVTGVGFMPTGEGVDWNTQQPLQSTMSQPDDGGYNVQVALLNYLGLFDPRLPPL